MVREMMHPGEFIEIQEGLAIHARQLLLYEVGDRGLARAGQAGQPPDGWLLILQLRMVAARW
jgi:hypothetical protein